MEKKTMGGFIAALRRARGLSQQEVADRLNVSNKAVSKWERDESAPDISLIPAIAELFEVSCDEILLGGRITETSERSSSPKTDQQIRRLAGSTTTKFKNMTLLAGLFTGLGVALYFILNFLVDYSVGFFVFLILAVGSIIFEIIHYNNAVYQLKNNDVAASDSDVMSDARTTLYRSLFILASVNLLAFSVVLSFTFGLFPFRAVFALFCMVLWGSLKLLKNKLGFSKPVLRLLGGTTLRNIMNYFHWGLMLGMIYLPILFPGWQLSIFIFLVPLVIGFIIFTAMEKEKIERTLTALSGARNLLILVAYALTFNQFGYLHPYVILSGMALVVLSLLIKYFIIKKASSCK